jgi:hypothetical protein
MTAGSDAAIGVLYPGYRGRRLWPNKSGYDQFPQAGNGWGTMCVVLGLTPGRDMYSPFFTSARHTPRTLGSIIREPPILGKCSKNRHPRPTQLFNVRQDKTQQLAPTCAWQQALES